MFEEDIEITEEMRIEMQFESMRHERDRRLAMCDWVVTKAYSQGVPVPEEWANYMQALRDLPDNYDGSIPVNWPEKPE